MAAQTMLTKKVAISKANAQMVAVVAIAAFLTVFCLSASHAVWSLNSYHVRVENADDTANNQLEQDITAYNQLTNAYQSFASTPTNVLGGTR
jgi:capsular polysaccharide biosynthesis protein